MSLDHDLRSEVAALRAEMREEFERMERAADERARVVAESLSRYAAAITELAEARNPNGPGSLHPLPPRPPGKGAHRDRG